MGIAKPDPRQYRRIGRDGSHAGLPVVWQRGLIDAEYETLARELRGKGLIG